MEIHEQLKRQLKEYKWKDYDSAIKYYSKADAKVKVLNTDTNS